MKTSSAEPRTSVCAIDAEHSSNKSFFENADKPTLHSLSYALRHPEIWPEGFVWNYGECSQCAMGLAHALWKELPETNRANGASFMARAFAIPFDAASTIFMGKTGGYRAGWVPPSANKIKISGHLWWKTEKRTTDWTAVTPEMVADQIDKYIATAE